MGENTGTLGPLPLPVSGGAGTGKGQRWDDRTILGLLWDALHRESGVESSDCDLEVRDHVAYVRGTVSDMDAKRAVGRAAMSIPGLLGVINSLRVTPLSPRSDQRITSDVRAALLKAGMAGRPPEVKVVDGVVHLSGTVASIEAQRTSEDAAWSVPGVEQVVNDTVVTALCPRSDQEMLHDVNLALSYLGIGSKTVSAEVRNGTVYLRGRVESESQKLAVERAVAWTPCVVEVVDELNVSPRASG